MFTALYSNDLTVIKSKWSFSNNPNQFFFNDTNFLVMFCTINIYRIILTYFHWQLQSFLHSLCKLTLVCFKGIFGQLKTKPKIDIWSVWQETHTRTKKLKIIIIRNILYFYYLSAKMNGKNSITLNYIFHEQAQHWYDSHKVNGTGPSQDFSYRKARISQLLCSTIITLNFVELKAP